MTLNSFVNLLDDRLSDSWRVLHPGDWQYTFYSTPHRMHMRIDYLFVNNTTLCITRSAQIRPISWSDHSPILLTLDLAAPNRKPCHWQLNKFLLQHLPSKTKLESTLKLYFLENNTSAVSLATLWEAHKAVLQGRCIALTSAMKKDTRATKLQTERELRALELCLQPSPSLPLLEKNHPSPHYTQRPGTRTSRKSTD